MTQMLKGMANYLESCEGIKLGENKLDFLMLNVPPVCNYRCTKCFTQAYHRRPENSLSITKLKSLVDEAHELGARVVCVLGEGEPLVDKDIYELTAYISANNMIPLITTNGSLLTRENVDILHSLNATIVVSLDTLEPEDYKNYCGKNTDLQLVLDNIEYVRKKYSDKIEIVNGIKAMAFAIHTTVTAMNLDQVYKIHDYCGNDIFHSVEHIAKVGEANANPDIYGENDEYKKCKEVCLSIMDPMVLCKTPNNQSACCLFYYGIAVGYEGEIMLDTHAVETRGHIGSVLTDSLETLVSKANDLKSIYFNQFEGCYCLIRDDRYPEFLEILKEKF